MILGRQHTVHWLGEHMTENQIKAMRAYVLSRAPEGKDLVLRGGWL